MAGKVLSISLGSEIVKVCEVAHAGKRKVQVYNAIDLIIPEGLCDDGVILDAEALASAIRQGLEGEGFSAKRIIFTITSKRIANKEAIIPFCKESRISDIIHINASEYFPISNLENYTFNYSIIEVVQNEGVKNYRLSVTATPNELIEQYYELAKALGMSVETIDYSGNSILQLLKLQTAGEGVDAVLQVGGENSVVNIMNGTTMVMQRSVPYGRLAIADAVAVSRNISEDEADMVLINEDLGRLSDRYPDVADAVRSLLSSVGRILEFYRARNAENPIERLYIIGDVTSVNGLAEMVDRELDMDVEVIESLRGVEIKNHRELTDEIVANYLANIGAVIEPMRIMLSTAKRPGERVKDEKLPWWILVFAAVVAGAMCGALLFLHHMKKEENEAIQAQIDAIGDVESIKAEYEQSQSDVEIMENWYDSTKGNNESLIRFIEDLEKVQPSAVAITSFSSTEGEVSITGQSYGKPAAAQFLIELKKLPYIKNVRMQFLNESIEDYSARDSFSITLKLEYEDPFREVEDSETSEDVVAEETSEIPPSEEENEEPYVEEVSEDAIPDESEVESESTGEEPIEETMEGGVE